MNFGEKVIHFAISCYTTTSVFKMPYLRHVREMLLLVYDLSYIEEVEFAVLYDLNKSKNSLTKNLSPFETFPVTKSYRSMNLTVGT